MYKEAGQYGAERQANTRAAVEAGLANLAQAAGFPDVARMEWQLESELSEALTPLEEWVDALEWQIRLAIVGITPRIEASRNGKALKSIPAKVRKTESYALLRETQEVVKDQARRFRSALESMMCNEE